MNYAQSLAALTAEMEACEQAPGLNMLQHGQMVHEEYKKLIAHSIKHAELAPLFERFGPHLPPAHVLERYHTLHDCAKHLCLEIGEDGKRRFPNHAEVSSKQYLTIFPEDGFTGQLIRMDMDFHILRGENLLELCKHPLAPILYFSAWAEINANAEMFGGKESASYKIKRSRLIQAGKKLLNT